MNTTSKFRMCAYRHCSMNAEEDSLYCSVACERYDRREIHKPENKTLVVLERQNNILKWLPMDDWVPTSEVYLALKDQIRRLTHGNVLRDLRVLERKGLVESRKAPGRHYRISACYWRKKK